MRRQTPGVKIGNVFIGSDYPIAVQSMTDTDTADVKATVKQIKALSICGSELVRLTVNHDAAAKAVPLIREQLFSSHIFTPLIGDFHYNGHLLLNRYPECASNLDKYRINPGNVGAEKGDINFTSIIETAIRFHKPVRIGVNWGSVDKQLLTDMMDKNARCSKPKSAKDIINDALIKSALSSAQLAEKIGLAHDQIILSAKVSAVPELIAIYRKLAGQCDYPLHLGLTEAGLGNKGIIASSTAIAVLLQEGIGDTIRVSLTPRPGGDRCEEVTVAQQILQSLELRHFLPQVTTCPGCGRTNSDLFRRLAAEISNHLSSHIRQWRTEYPGVEQLKIAVMGCVVNGPGESKHADIGISLPGSGEKPKAPVYIDGRHYRTLHGDNMPEQFIQIIEDYIAERFSEKVD